MGDSAGDAHGIRVRHGVRAGHEAESLFDINTVFAGILVLTAFALVLDWLVTMAETRLMVWQPRSGETERL